MNVALLLKRFDLLVSGSSQEVHSLVKLENFRRRVFGDLLEVLNSFFSRLPRRFLEGDGCYRNALERFFWDPSGGGKLGEYGGCLAYRPSYRGNLFCQSGQL
ncbi:hypothetical protein D3C86_1446930 [compost metagenome]